MDYDKEIVQFLSKSENIGLALEVVEHIDAVKDHLVRSFWTAALAELRERMEGVDGWTGKKSDAYDFTDAWGGLSIHPTGSDRFYVYPRAEQDGSGRVYFGVWKEGIPESVLEGQPFGALQAKLRSQGCTRGTHASAGYQFFDFELRSRSTLVQIASNDFGRAVTIAETLAGLFFETRTELEAVNGLVVR